MCRNADTYWRLGCRACCPRAHGLPQKSKLDVLQNFVRSRRSSWMISFFERKRIISNWQLNSFLANISTCFCRICDCWWSNTSIYRHSDDQVRSPYTRGPVCRSRYQGQGQAVTSHQYVIRYDVLISHDMWDVITCPCPWYLLLAHKFSYVGPPAPKRLNLVRCSREDIRSV